MNNQFITKFLLVLLISIFKLTGDSYAQTNQFPCDGKMYMVEGNLPVNLGTSQYPYRLYYINTSTNPATHVPVGSSTSYQSLSVGVNAIAMNPIDRLIYGISNSGNTHYLYSIDSSGKFTQGPLITQFSALGNVVNGTFDNLGNYWVNSGNSTKIYKFNVSSVTSPSYSNMDSFEFVDVNNTSTIIELNFADFAYSTDGYIYGRHIIGNPTNISEYYKINTTPNANGDLEVTKLIPSYTYSNFPTYGAMWSSSNGNIYALANNFQGGIVQIDRATGDTMVLLNTPQRNFATTSNPNPYNIINNDGANCINASITFTADLSVTKTDVKTTYFAGGTTTYTIVAKNNGPTNIYKGKVLDPLPAGLSSADVSYTAVASSIKSKTSVVGTQAGAISDIVDIMVGETITYTVTVSIPSTFTGNLTNTATIELPNNSDFSDPNPNNNTATDIDIPVYVDPDYNSGLVNQTLSGSLETNDVLMPLNSTYGTPTVPTGVTNPNSTLPTINTDGTYTFNTTVPDVYVFDVPVCPPGVTLNCPINRLTITIADNLSTTNPPVANVDIATTKVNTPVTLNTVSNDFGGANSAGLDPTSVTVSSTGGPDNGTYSIDPNTGNITYTPNPGFVGIDTIYYSVCDLGTPTQCTNSYQVITVVGENNNVTSAADDYVNVPLGGTVSGNIKTNDVDIEGNSTQITTPVTNMTVTGGTITIDAYGNYTFVSNGTYVGPVNVPYTICDNVTPIPACDEATLYILISTTATPTPVTIKEFYGDLRNNTTYLNWEVENETMFSHYELERSIDGVKFGKVAQIKAENLNLYQYNDKLNGLNGKISYRLKLVDFDGSFEYSKVISFLVEGVSVDQLWPNPTKDVLNIKLNVATEGIANIKLIDAVGRVVLEDIRNLNKGTETLSINGLDNFANGVYTLIIMQNNKQIIKKVSLQ